MKKRTHLLSFKSAGKGFVKETKMYLKDSKQDILVADIICETIPEHAALTLWLVQGEKTISIDVTKLSEPLEYDLHEFSNGEIRVRLQIDGVENVSSKIYIQQ